MVIWHVIFIIIDININYISYYLLFIIYYAVNGGVDVFVGQVAQAKCTFVDAGVSGGPNQKMRILLGK